MLPFDDYYKHQEEMLIVYMEHKYNLEHNDNKNVDVSLIGFLDSMIHRCYMDIRCFNENK